MQRKSSQDKLEETICSKIKYDGPITIATGSSCKSKNWKNKNILYSELVRKLSNTTRTPETYAEYKKFPKAERDRIKDVGGFVGGTLKGGRRKKENVANRTLLTLDLDYVTGDIWSSIELLWDFAVVMYSTHSHAVDNQRLRLVIPLSRPVLPDEYQAIARMVADDLGIDQFDDTTYEPSRLMFWPSTSSDGDYVFKVQDLKWLNPDDVLARYTFGWQDVSYWPQSSREKPKILSDIKKQEDPLTKKGIIGAFCRTYTITEAIAEFLSDIYVPGADDTRYTYAAGSTTGGVVVYDDKFSYSHHGTDPASNILCNAFDLVRIHKFGHLDEEAKEGTKVNKPPSFLAMEEFASSDSKVKILLTKESMEKAQEDFDTVIPKEELDTKWMQGLTYTGQGKLKNTVKNLRLIIENDPLIKGKYYYDLFESQPKVRGKLPWDSSFEREREWKDTDDSALREYIENYHHISFTLNKYTDAIGLAFDNNSIHPVREYLKNITWDGKPRLETIFIDYLGAEDNDYNRMVAKKALVAAVTRVFNPGTKYEEIPILVSTRQGVGKTTLISKLGGKWYNDNLSFDDIKGDIRKAVEQTEGSWILEIGELKGISSKDVDRIKSFMSGTVDKVRKAYARRTSKVSRQFIIFGTTNNQEFLSDRTGNRRFLPVTVDINNPTKSVFDEPTDMIKLTDEVDQIWAEAYHYFKKGYRIYLNKMEKELAAKYQELYTYSSNEETDFLNYLEIPIKKVDDRNKDWYSLPLSERLEFLYPSEEFLNNTAAEGIQTERRDKICTIAIFEEFYSHKYPLKYTSLTKELEIEIKNMLIRAGWRKYMKNGGRMKFGVYGLKTAYVRQ